MTTILTSKILPFALLLAACGSTPDSKIAADAPLPLAPTHIESFDAEYNVDYEIGGSKLAVKANILKGSNSCVASQYIVRLKVEESADEIAFVPERVRVADQQIICNAMYAPVYEEVEATIQVDFEKKRIPYVIKMIGPDKKTESINKFLANKYKKEVVLSNVVATPINAGVNPQAYAYRLSAEVFLGTNSCHAIGKTFEFSQIITEEETFVVGHLLTDPIVQAEVCIALYDPVVEHVTTEVRGFEPGQMKVVVKNVDQMGNDVSLVDLTP